MGSTFLPVASRARNYVSTCRLGGQGPSNFGAQVMLTSKVTQLVTTHLTRGFALEVSKSKSVTVGSTARVARQLARLANLKPVK